jgi:hypothetical protein
VLGKPVKGQRTWTNSKTAYKNNTYVRKLIKTLFNSTNKESEKIFYTKIKKIVKKKTSYKINKTLKNKEILKLKTWF